MPENNQENRYILELKKFAGQDCIVTDVNGKLHKGKCLAINFMYLNIVLMTKTEKIIIKNISHIRRQRDKKWKEEKP